MTKAQTTALSASSLVLGVLGVLGLGWASSCSGTFPKPNVERQACYLQAEARADNQATVECQGFTWQGCPARPRIMRDLRAAQEACP